MPWILIFTIPVCFLGFSLVGEFTDIMWIKLLLCIPIGFTAFSFVAPFISTVIIGLGSAVLALLGWMRYKLKALPLWVQWALYVPAILVSVFVLTWFPSLFVTLMTPEESTIRNLLKLGLSAYAMAGILWSSVILAPKSPKNCARVTFAFLAVFILVSFGTTLAGQNIFGGEPLPPNLASFWMLQDFVWLCSGLASFIYFSKNIEANMPPPKSSSKNETVEATTQESPTLFGTARRVAIDERMEQLENQLRIDPQPTIYAKIRDQLFELKTTDIQIMSMFVVFGQVVLELSEEKAIEWTTTSYHRATTGSPLDAFKYRTLVRDVVALDCDRTHGLGDEHTHLRSHYFFVLLYLFAPGIDHLAIAKKGG